MKKTAILVLIILFAVYLPAQEKLTYQKPPKEILELADFKRAPSVFTDSKYEKMVFSYRDTYKSIGDLSEKEMKLAGLRINPKTNISSSVRFVNEITYKNLYDTDEKRFEGMPGDAKISHFGWSPDETKLAFTNTTQSGVELWYADFGTGKAHKVTDANLNANLSSPYTWYKDGNAFLVRVLPENRPGLIDMEEAIPQGPIVSVSEKGVKAQNRTYQDLLDSPESESNFETICMSELYKVDLSGNKELWKEKDLYIGETFSPDGQYILITTISRPYSYLVPYSRFPTRTGIYTSDGKLVSVFNEKPLIEVMPKGFMATRTGKRNISWRKDKASTLYWVEALDEGDPAKQVEYREELFELPAPFDGKPTSLAKFPDRFSSITWGNDEAAIVYTQWRDTRNTKTFVISPSKPQDAPRILSDRNYQDIYSDPGSFNIERNQYGQYVLHINGGNAYLIGDGYSEEGKFPFVDEINLKSGQKKRLYQSRYTDKLLSISSILNIKKGEYLVRIESQTEYPNYYVVNTKKKTPPLAITNFSNPFGSIASIHKEIIKYRRDDGVELSGTLYLPVGYDMNKKERLPMVMWAYPTEYKDKSSAGQSTANPNKFTYPSYGTPIYWVTRGYAVLDNAAFPIVGEGDKEPNDTFIEQLIANAKAAIDAVDSMGYIDRKRVAVGGHSYGAFMTANLLTHCDLFAAGIARSGAYNRTLTPFGFQGEERNYWDVPGVYNTMSPFMHVDKIKHPLLLIHGGNDNNSGTYTMQSERYFNALKGFGVPARLVILPNESHGYAAKESVLHMLWEQDQWLEKYVKNRDLTVTE